MRALVGGRNYARAPYNRAVSARRQPGSSIKPFVYAKAIEDSIPANTIVPDTALSIDLPGAVDPYKPEEIDGKFWGSVVFREGKPTSNLLTMREGLIHSRNMVAIQLGQRVGNGFRRRAVAANGHQHADGSGAGERDRRVGCAPDRARRGLHGVRQQRRGRSAAIHHDASMILSGRHVFMRPPSTPQQVLDPRVAFIMRDMLRDNAERGTGVAARKAGA